ncbi:hypothetical protein C8P63_14612 [Melghirimyces profundicolus]|uniref:Antitoxin VbhA domain-containing protein n=1 Tax=Melghirimyces profundicolus TaxID=1242148 RepID=A0A2T6AWV9_9BACL|nr:hypothetical protein [Melghirimyces profundicolus]PTX48303.1 hypothetical protein C8P63_14612 [Melghirimyces profundicolus]
MRTEEQVKRMMDAAKASLAIEGLHTTETEDQLIKKRLMSEISQEEFLQRAKELAIRKE